jgi:hypothetical protein
MSYVFKVDKSRCTLVNYDEQEVTRFLGDDVELLRKEVRSYAQQLSIELGPVFHIIVRQWSKGVGQWITRYDFQSGYDHMSNGR